RAVRSRAPPATAGRRGGQIRRPRLEPTPASPLLLANRVAWAKARPHCHKVNRRSLDLDARPPSGPVLPLPRPRPPPPPSPTPPRAGCQNVPHCLVTSSAERSAARLAHQSGGLGVPSSNLGAPTNKFNSLCDFASQQNSPGKHLGNRDM